MYLPGDVLETPKGPFSHIGIYVDTNTVFHNSPGSGECVTSLSEFSNGAGIDLRHRPSVRHISRIMNGVDEMLARPKRYNALTNNCEHSVAAALSGRPSSPQLQAWVLGAATVITTLTAIRALRR